MVSTEAMKTNCSARDVEVYTESSDRIHSSPVESLTKTKTAGMNIDAHASDQSDFPTVLYNSQEMALNNVDNIVDSGSQNSKVIVERITEECILENRPISILPNSELVNDAEFKELADTSRFDTNTLNKQLKIDEPYNKDINIDSNLANKSTTDTVIPHSKANKCAPEVDNKNDQVKLFDIERKIDVHTSKSTKSENQCVDLLIEERLTEENILDNRPIAFTEKTPSANQVGLCAGVDEQTTYDNRDSKSEHSVTDIDESDILKSRTLANQTITGNVIHEDKSNNDTLSRAGKITLKGNLADIEKEITIKECNIISDETIVEEILDNKSLLNDNLYNSTSMKESSISSFEVKREEMAIKDTSFSRSDADINNSGNIVEPTPDEDVLEWEETLSDGTVIKHRKVTKQVCTSNVSNTMEQDISEPVDNIILKMSYDHNDVSIGFKEKELTEWEETLSDGRVIKHKKNIKSYDLPEQNKIATVPYTIEEEVSTEQPDDQVKEWEEKLEDGSIIKRRQLLNDNLYNSSSMKESSISSLGVTREEMVLKDISFRNDADINNSDNNFEPTPDEDVLEWEETLSDGTIIKHRKVTKQVCTSTVSNTMEQDTLEPIDSIILKMPYDHNDVSIGFKENEFTEWEETLSDGRVIKHQKNIKSYDVPKQNEIATVPYTIEEVSTEQPDDQVEEWEEKLEDGSIIKRRQVTRFTHTQMTTSSTDSRLITDLHERPILGGKNISELTLRDLSVNNDTIKANYELGTVVNSQIKDVCVDSNLHALNKPDTDRSNITSVGVAGPSIRTAEDEIIPELIERAECGRPGNLKPSSDDEPVCSDKIDDFGLKVDEEIIEEVDVIPGNTYESRNKSENKRPEEQSDEDEIIPVIIDKAEAGRPYSFGQDLVDDDISQVTADQVNIGNDHVKPIDETDIVPGEDFINKDDQLQDANEDVNVDLNQQVMFLPPELVDQENVQSPSDFDEIEETLSDGTIVKRKLLKTKVKKIITKKIRRVGPDGDIIEDIITEEVPESEFSDTSSLRSSLSGSCCDFTSSIPSVSSPAEPDYNDSDAGTVRVYTDTIEGDPQEETDFQEFEETLPDGTIIKRKVTKTRHKQTIVKRVVMEGPELDLPTTEEQAQIMLNQGNVFEPEVNYYTDKSHSEPEQSTNVEEYEDIQPDGSKVKRKIVRTTEQQLTTERTMKEGLGSQIPDLMGLSLEGNSTKWVEVPDEAIVAEDSAQAQSTIPSQNGAHTMFSSPEPDADPVEGEALEEDVAADGDDQTTRIVMKKRVHKKTIIRDGKEETIVTEDAHITQDDEGPEELRDSMQQIIEQFLSPDQQATPAIPESQQQ